MKNAKLFFFFKYYIIKNEQEITHFFHSGNGCTMAV